MKAILKPGREKSVLRKHPWVFASAIEELEGNPNSGDTLDVVDPMGRFLARGAFSPASQIRLRLWTWNESEAVDEAFFRTRLAEAINLRRMIFKDVPVEGMRLVHGESDGLPGLIVDQYQKVLVLQCLSAGIDTRRELLVQILGGLTECEGIYERSDVDVRRLEGLTERSGLLSGTLPKEGVIIHEGGARFTVDIVNGHKTGFYLDQRANRARIAELARDRHVMDCFCYTGGFSVSALLGGAKSVVAVDSSSTALESARENLSLNGLAPGNASWVEGDVFHVLRKLRDRGKNFDLIILDPPKFAHTAAHAEKAARGYKDINLLAFKLLRHSGILVTFSCSGGVNSDLFKKIVSGAALDAGVDARILERLSQAPDHPVGLNFPEGEYLKGLVVAVR